MSPNFVIQNGQLCFSAACCFLLLSACSGSGSDNSDAAPGTPDTEAQNPITLGQDMTPDNAELGVVGALSTPAQPVPEELASLENVSLVINADSRCTVVGETLSVSVSRALTEAEIAAGEPTSAPDVTSYVSYSQGFGDSLSLISVVDNEASFTLTRQDVISLSVALDNGSVTAYLAGFAAETPASAVLRKAVPGGCLYAFQTPGYCATGLAKGGTLTFSRDGQGISAMGCELDNPGGLPVFDLAPAEPL